MEYMLAAGVLGMSEFDFWHTTPGYMSALTQGHQRRQQHDYEVARYVSMHALFPLKPYVLHWRIERPTDLGYFDWEAETKRENMVHPDSPELKAAFDKIDEWVKNGMPKQIINQANNVN